MLELRLEDIYVDMVDIEERLREYLLTKFPSYDIEDAVIFDILHLVEESIVSTNDTYSTPGFSIIDLEERP